MERYGRTLDTPIGVAAGPHTQLAQNIVASWLCGARYIELKTIQTLDELEVAKPCIDMQDEGYNCEWSQELKIHQSFTEYLNAWILIHILHKELGHPGTQGALFNMSVGYNMEGILQDNVQWFLQKMSDCALELEQAKRSIRNLYPQIDSVEIPTCISNHITLSTMHGCPPDEIEKIGVYLIREKKLHTTIKLNPTLLGADELRKILNNQLRFETEVPDLAFEHDLKYPDALNMIRKLKKASDESGLQFSVKLTNTLESRNNKNIFNEKESMMYMSGRALHPISINLAHKLSTDFRGELDISFSAGVDCFNVAETLSCGLRPVTVCSDLLKPGGYGRLWQYIRNLKETFQENNAGTIDAYIHAVSGQDGISREQAALINLRRYKEQVLQNPAYQRTSLTDPDIKTTRELGYFDCIHAPCEDTCPTHQGIPEYMHHTASGDPSAALETILQTNPFPNITGMICDHPCQLKCTRINYDESLHIREIKRFISETVVNEQLPSSINPVKKAAIIGAGPAGLSCAWFLRQAGFQVNLYEQKNITGGMVSAAIPAFRLTGDAIEKDIEAILASGIKLHDNYTVSRDNFHQIKEQNDAVFISTGAQASVKLELEGIDSEGVLDPLDFLYKVKEDKPVSKGQHIIIIGGGNTAMDAARTAYRIVGKEGSVTIVYRRTIREMPADKGEIKAVMEEGIKVLELTHPERIHAPHGKVEALQCSRTILVMKGKDGRPMPVKVPGSEFLIPCDTIIPAIGQKLAIDFISPEDLTTLPGNYKTRLKGVYIGGDAMRGASTAINAIADGRLAAAEIISDLGLQSSPAKGKSSKNITWDMLMHRRSLREYGISPRETDLDNRRNFNLVMSGYQPDEAIRESSRCLYCDELCNTCVTVCPNLANYSYTIEPVKYHLKKAVKTEDGKIIHEPDQEFCVEQPYQILNIRDLCNECGNCTTFCPSSGKPYTDKPGLCLSIETLNQEGEGYYLSRLHGSDILIHKHHESIRTLTLSNGKYTYETDQVRAVIRPTDFELQEIEFLTPCVKECQFVFAAEMSIVMKGAMEVGVL